MPTLPTIDGATPIDDISGLKLPVTTRDALNAAEAENIAKAVLKYLAKKPSRRSAPFDVRWMLQLHREMFGEVWEWAGQIRTSPLPTIGVPAHQIREELGKLIGDLLFWKKSTMDITEQAVRLHHRAVWIHPFLNGNGRWSRMLADIWLRQQGQKIPIWPVEVNTEASRVRAKYIQAVKDADGGDFGKLLALYRQFIPK